MSARLLLTAAGSGATNNLVRSLHAGDPTLVVVGCHHDRFTLTKSSAARNHLVVAPTHRRFAEEIRAVVVAERIDLVIPTTDAHVVALSAFRDRVGATVFLPSAAMLETCLDKYALATALRGHDVPVPWTHLIERLDDVDAIFAAHATESALWCRLRRGSGAMGALRVSRPEHARGWITYWEEMRDVPPASFTLSEYLPGRDFAAQSVWREGRPVLVKTFERLSYDAGTGSPSGISSVAALAKAVREPEVARVSLEAIRALDPGATGIFGVDLRMNRRGVPCVTEINAGRFSLSTNIYDLVGRHNMASTFVRTALGEPVAIDEVYDAVDEDVYLVRDADTLPTIVSAERLFEVG
jgi:carbamoyl-phosphate synthase large subunit